MKTSQIQFRCLAGLAGAAASLLFAACGPKGAPGVVPVPENISKEALEPLVRSIDLVPLETHGDDFLGEGTNLILADGNYLLEDPGNRKLHLYGPDGKFLNRIGREGRGPEEYHSIWNTLYTGGRVYVYQGGSEDLLVYRQDGSFEKKLNLPAEGGNAFFPLKDGYLAYIGYLGPGDDMIQWIPEGQEPVSLVPKRGLTVASMQQRPFSEYGGRIFMPDAMGEKVYAFADGKAETLLNLDFGRFTAGEELFSGDVEAAMRVLSTRHATVGAYWENERMRVVEAQRSEKKDDSSPFPDREILYGLFLHGKWNWVNTGDIGATPFAHSVSGLDGDALVCLLDPLLLKEMDPALKAKISNPQVLDTLDENSNFVVAKLHLK